jgi:hypothetical protein
VIKRQNTLEAMALRPVPPIVGGERPIAIGREQDVDVASERRIHSAASGWGEPEGRGGVLP